MYFVAVSRVDTDKGEALQIVGHCEAKDKEAARDRFNAIKDTFPSSDKDPRFYLLPYVFEEI